VASYVVKHAARLRSDPFIDKLVAAALEVRAAQPGSAPSSGVLAEPLTAAEERVLQLLPTSTYLQIADTLYIFTQHGEDPPAVDLPETRSGVTLGGARASGRPAPALSPRRWRESPSVG
jgi:hypothetical protein